MPFWKNKRDHNAYTTEILPSKEPLRNSTIGTTGVASLADYEQKDLQYKRHIRILRFISRTITLLLSAVAVSTLSYALAKYYLTRSRTLPPGAPTSHPWITPTTLWPTFMLLAISILTFLLNLFTVCAYLCSVRAANKTSSATSVIGYLFLAAQVVAWAVASGLYRMARDGTDLWGYSCSDKADLIQADVHSFLNFGTLCTMQQGTWWVSVVQAIVYVITFISAILVLKRSSHKKKMAAAREGFARNTEY